MKYFRIIPIIIVLVCWSCTGKSTEEDQPLPEPIPYDDQRLSDEEISNNLLISGDIDPENLIGEWGFKEFAYTADGIKFWSVDELAYTIVIQTFNKNEDIGCGLNPEDFDLRMFIRSRNTVSAYVSLSGNLIDFKECGSVYPYSLYHHIEDDICKVMNNVHSFVIRNDELIFYFKGDEYKNLLILKKSNKDLISDNLSKKGNVDPALLIGEWDCIKFAGTTDGIAISDGYDVTKGRVRITETGLWLFHTSTKYYPRTTNGKWLRTGSGVTALETYELLQEEYTISSAIQNMYSYVIRNDELIIYFHNANGFEVKNNLLILKRCSPPHDVISSNLLKIGNVDPDLLIGEWDCIKFAYTADGIKIIEESYISSSIVTIPDMANLRLSITDPWGTTNDVHFDYTVSGNLIGLQFRNLAGNALAFALANTYSFVIVLPRSLYQKDDELIIYFIGTDTRNLIILKKRKS